MKANNSTSNERLGILVGGGPAPGINGVISAATTEAARHGLDVVGITDGFKWLARGDVSCARPLAIEDVIKTRCRGGSVLRTSRENPTKDGQRMRNVVEVLRKLDVRYLLTIGGDDTAFSASKTCEGAAGAIKVAHVPKTIDNDLPLPGNMPTFGFETARHVGSRLVANLMEDAQTTQRWYIVVVMGRSTGHLALGAGAAGGASLTLIPEEFAQFDSSFGLVCDVIEGAIIKAKALGRHYGAVVVAEGVAEGMAKELQGNPLVVVKHDQHEHLRLAEVPLALILRRVLQERFDQPKGKVAFVDVTIGYELRCADPVPFDAEYAQQLGWGAVRYLLGIAGRNCTGSGAVMSIQAGKLVPIPFADILDPETGKTAVRRVDLSSDQYQCARSFMLRIRPSDLANDEQVARMSVAAGLPPDEFRDKYGRLAGL